MCWKCYSKIHWPTGPEGSEVNLQIYYFYYFPRGKLFTNPKPEPSFTFHLANSLVVCNEATPPAGSDSTAAQHIKCSQHVTLATRKLPQLPPLSFLKALRSASDKHPQEGGPPKTLNRGAGSCDVLEMLQ
jgi:hypothetical protein